VVGDHFVAAGAAIGLEEKELETSGELVISGVLPGSEARAAEKAAGTDFKKRFVG